MHLLTIVRAYLGLSQTELAKASGITQADLSEMETREPYGQISKYQRISNYLGIPVDTILKNDFRSFPDSFFEKHPAPTYLPPPTSPEQLLGRQGEDFIFEREQARVGLLYPALAKLILPYFKLREVSPGYDILTYDESGRPYYLEVKTSTFHSGGFRFTNHELDVARKKTAAGEQYVICYISDWATDEQTERDIPFSELQSSFRIDPCYYFCKPLPKLKEKPISGLAYFRLLRGLRQADISTALNIPQSDWSLYENGQRKPSVTVYLKASILLDASVDDLLKTYSIFSKRNSTV